MESTQKSETKVVWKCRVQQVVAVFWPLPRAWPKVESKSDCEMPATRTRSAPAERFESWAAALEPNYPTRKCQLNPYSSPQNKTRKKKKRRRKPRLSVVISHRLPNWTYSPQSTSSPQRATYVCAPSVNRFKLTFTLHQGRFLRGLRCRWGAKN